jgi:hypothetical protein
MNLSPHKAPRYSISMKLLLAAALLLSPLALTAQTGSMPAMPAKPPVPPSHSLTLVNGATTKTLTVSDLAKLPQVTVHVHNAHRNTDEDYTGPLVSDVLALAGLAPTHENEAAILHTYVVAAATDHYSVVYSAAEMEPGFSNSKVIVAISKAGGPNTEGGEIQLINTDGARPARWIHGLTTLTVNTLPPTK